MRENIGPPGRLVVRLGAGVVLVLVAVSPSASGKPSQELDVAVRRAVTSPSLSMENRARIRAIESRQSGELFVEPHSDLGLKTLAGRQLESPSCAASTVGLRRYSEQWIHAALDCGVDELAPLFQRNPGAKPSAESFVLLRKDQGHSKQEIQLVLQQQFQGTDVFPGTLRLHYIRGKLVSASGQVWSTVTFIGRPEGADERIARSAYSYDPRLAKSAQSQRYFDAERMHYVQEMYLGMNRYLFRELDGALIAVEPAGHGLAESNVAQQVNVYRFDHKLVLTGTERTNSVELKSSLISETDIGNGLCEYRPEILDVSPGPGNLAGANQVVEMQYGDRKTDTPMVVVDSCGAQPFKTPAPGSWEFFTASTNYHIQRMSQLFEHPTSYFYYAHANEELVGKVDEDLFQNGVSPPSWDGFYGGNKLIVRQSPTVTGPAQNASNMATIAHEYGHFITDMYLTSPGMAGAASGAFFEGWGEHMPLRYAIYAKNVLGEWNNLTYSNLDFDNHTTNAHASHGQVVPVSGTYQYYPDPIHCDDENGPLRYQCATVMLKIYWELAWNTCRAGYGTCETSLPLIESGPYAGQAWKLANSAFAYGHANIGFGGFIGDFFQLVQIRYSQFANNGEISWADYTRVSDALARHCLGWNSHCGDSNYRVMPGSGGLPSKFVKKSRFADQFHYLSEFFRADDMTASGTPANASFGTVGDGYGYKTLNSGDDALAKYVFFPVGGLYNFEASVRVAGVNTSVWLHIDSGSPLFWGLGDAQAGVWDWSTKAGVYVPSGTHKVTLSHNKDVDIEAINISYSTP